MNYLVNLNLNKNQLQNAVVHPLTVAPANPVTGQIYYNSTDKFIYVYDGAAWKPVGVVYKQANSTGAVITALDEKGNVTTTEVKGLTLNGITPVDGGYVTEGMTLEAAIKALDAVITALDEKGNVTTTEVKGLTLNGITPVDGGYVTEGMTLEAAIKALDEAVKNAVAGGGEVNQNAFSNVVTSQQSNADTAVVGNADGAVTIAADAKTDSVTIASGNKWVQIKGNAGTKTATIGHQLSGVAAKAYGSATAVAKVTVDAAGHVTAAEDVTIVGAEYITGLTSDAQAQLDAKIPASQKGQANGVATLGGDGLVPTTQLPSYVDDVIEAYVRTAGTELSADWLSTTGPDGEALTPEKGKIYVIVSEGKYKDKQYRWGGTTYVLCNPSDVNSVNGKTGVVVLTQDDIAAGNNNEVFTKEEKAKLTAIEAEATKNTITMNGQENANPIFYAPADGGTAGQVFYAPADGGTAGQVLTSAGANAAPVWAPAPESVHKHTEENKKITAAGGAFEWKIAAATHKIQNPAMFVQVYEVASGDAVMTDVKVNQATYEVTITINDVAAANTLTASTYRAVLVG